MDVGIRRALELLDEALSVALVGLYLEVMVVDLAAEVLLGLLNVLLNLLVEVESDGLRLGESGADGRVVKVELVVEDKHVQSVVQAMSWGAVHFTVFALETRRAVVVNDELQRFVEPAVSTVSVPELARTLLESDWRSIVQTDNKRRRFDVLDRGFVSFIGVEEAFASL